jgi:hypothetical protein
MKTNKPKNFGKGNKKNKQGGGGRGRGKVVGFLEKILLLPAS